VKRQSLCGSGFSLSAVCTLAKPYHLGENLPTTLCENKNGVHFFTPDLNAIIGIKSNYCVILKMVILHDAIQTIQNSVFFSKKNKNLFIKKNRIKKTKTCELFFLNLFFPTLIIFQSLFVIFP